MTSLATVLCVPLILVCWSSYFLVLGHKVGGQGHGGESKFSWEQWPNTSVLSLKKGQDITLTCRDLSLGLLHSVGDTCLLWYSHFKIQNQQNYSSERFCLACAIRYSELFVSLKYHFLVLYFLFHLFLCFLLLLCENRVACNPFCHFSSGSQLFFITCFPSLAASLLAPSHLFSSFSYLPKSDLNKSMAKSFEYKFCLQAWKQATLHCSVFLRHKCCRKLHSHGQKLCIYLEWGKNAD